LNSKLEEVIRLMFMMIVTITAVIVVSTVLKIDKWMKEWDLRRQQIKLEQKNKRRI